MDDTVVGGVGTFSIVRICNVNGRLVAIKYMKDRTKVHKYLKPEVTILKQLQHPNIVTMLDYSIDEGTITFEALDHSLLDVIHEYADTDQYMSLHRLRSISKGILSALCELKTHGIIHCDIKPENVLFKGDSVKLIDFGNACYGHSPYSQTISYAPPEVIIKAPVSWESDIWSFGCMLFEMATNEYLFEVIKDNMSERCYLLAQIVALCGIPPYDYLKKGHRSKRYFSPDLLYHKYQYIIKPCTLQDALNPYDIEASTKAWLLRIMMRIFVYTNRASPEELMTLL